MKQEDEPSKLSIVETKSETDLQESQYSTITQQHLANKTKEQNNYIKKFNKKHRLFKETLKEKIKGKKSKFFDTQNWNLEAKLE